MILCRIAHIELSTLRAGAENVALLIRQPGLK